MAAVDPAAGAVGVSGGWGAIMAAAMAAPTITPLLIDLIEISPVASMLELSVVPLLSPQIKTNGSTK